MRKVKIMRKIVAALLLTSVATQYTVQPMHLIASEVYDLTDNEKGAVESRCRVLQSYLTSTANGQYGLLYQLNALAEYLMYVKFITDKAVFSPGEKAVYQDDAATKIKDFNKKFGESSSIYKYEPLMLVELDYSTEDKFRETIVSDISDKILQYVDAVYSGISIEYMGSLKDIAKSEDTLKQYSSELRMLYCIVQTYEDTILDLTNHSSNINGSDSVYSVDGTKGNQTVTEKINTIKTNYKDLYDAGKDLEEAYNSASTGITVDNSKSAVENFSDAIYYNNELQISSDPELTGAYLSILACSSIYVPFKSFAGSEEFLSSLSYLAANDTQAKELTQLYNETKSYRKPLYYRELDDNGAPVGVAKILTIEEFVNKVKSGSAFALVTINGAFELDTESQAWIYNSTKGVKKANTDAVNTTGTATAETEATTEAGLATPSTETETESETSGGAAQAQEVDPDVTIVGKVLDTYDNVAVMTNGSSSSTATAKYAAWDLLVNYARRKCGFQEKDLVGSMTNKKNVLAVVAKAKADTSKAVTAWSKNINLKVLESRLNRIGATRMAIRSAYCSYFSSVNPNYFRSSTADTNHNNGNYASTTKENADAIMVMLGIDSYAEKKGISTDTLFGTKKKVDKNLISLLTQAKADNESWMNGIVIVDLKKQFQTDLYAKNKYDKASVKQAIANYLEKTTQATEKSTESESETEATTEAAQQTTEMGTDSLDNQDTQYTDNNAEYIIYADEEITDVSKMSQPVMYVGTTKNRAVDNFTTAILTNIFEDSLGYSNVKNPDIRFVFVNAFGDIVLDDNMIVLPGLANPIMWDSNAAYNPYTAAFMNAYPSILYKATYYSLYDLSDLNKFVLFSDNSDKGSITGTSEILDGWKFPSYLYKSNSTKSFSKTKLDSLMIDNSFDLQDGSGETKSLFRIRSFLYSTGTQADDSVAPFCLVNENTVNSALLFPYSASNDVGYANAKIIAGNAYNKLMKDVASAEEVNQKKLNDNYILHNFIIANLDGTDNPLSYTKNSLLQYDQFVNNSMSRAEEFIQKATKSALSSLESVKGVLGIGNIYNQHGFGTIMNFAREYFWWLIAAISFLVLISYLKQRRNFFQGIVTISFTGLVTYLFIWVVPIYLPYILNSVTNNAAENLAYEIVAAKTEARSVSTTDASAISSDVGNEASITLYRYKFYKIKEMCDSLNIDVSEVINGRLQVVNNDVGMYIQNDSIKIDLDSLLGTLKIVGGYDGSDYGNVYQLKSYKTVSSNVDYYTPYYQIVDGFLDKINTLVGIYNIPRKMNTYSNNIQKDAYGVQSYITSLPFISPGVYLTDIDQEYESSLGVSKEALDTYVAESSEMAQKLESAFGTNDDWLGLSSVLLDLNTQAKGTLWANVLQKNGYYDSEWNANEEKLGNLIHYVNYVTKKFVYDTEDALTQFSDDTAVKIIALRALTALNQRAMEYTSPLFPLFLNYEDIPLGDIMLALFTDDYSALSNYDMDPVRYVMETSGWLYVLVVGADLGLVTLMSFILTYLFPLLYVALAVLVLLRMLFARNIHPVIKGYVKLTGLSFFVFTGQCLVLLFTADLNASVLGIIVMLFGCLFLIWILVAVVTSFLVDAASLGNNAINAKISKLPFMKNHLTHTDHTVIYNNNRKDEMADKNFISNGLDAYSFDEDIDSLYENGLSDNDDLLDLYRSLEDYDKEGANNDLSD